MSAGVIAGEKFRVFMTTDGVGGVWQYALELARGFAVRGIETIFAVLGPSLCSAQSKEADRVPNLHVIETGLPLDWTATAPGEVDRAGRVLAELAGRYAADVVHLNAPALAVRVEYHAPLVVVAHSCVATWWRAVRGGPMPADFEWRTRCMARGLAMADVIIAPSRSFAAALTAVYGPDLKVAVVHNGRDRPSGSDGLQKDHFVLAAGRLWDEGKNIATLDRAAARMRAPVFAAGPLTGPDGSTTRYAHLRHIGQLSETELAAWYSAAPVFASVARYEPFGLAVLEAGRSGSALVLSDIPTFRELWEGAALFVDGGDDLALGHALQDLLDSPGRVRSLAAAARARSSGYSSRAMVEATLNVYWSVSPRHQPTDRLNVAH